VETATRSPKQQTVYFYNLNGVLVYKEKLEGIRLNPEKRKTQMHLKQALEATVVAREQERKVRDSGSLVVNCLKGK
jgi:tRNA pseudouridine-54 N-methylase